MDSVEDKKELLRKSLQKDIKELEKEIDQKEIENQNLLKIRNLKIRKYVISYMVPYILAGGMSLVTANVLTRGNQPFIRDTKEQYTDVTSRYYSYGKEETKEEYKEEKKMKLEENKVYFCNSWIEDEKGNTATIHVYNLDSEEEGKKILDGFLKEEDLKKDYTTYQERKKEITEEEKNRGPYQVVETHHVKDYKQIQEDGIENFVYTSFYILLFAASQILTSNYQERHRRVYSLDIDRIKKMYPQVDVSKDQKKLELRKRNYNRLMGDSYEK